MTSLIRLIPCIGYGDKFCDFLGLTRFISQVCREKMPDPGRKKWITWRRSLAEKVSRRKKKSTRKRRSLPDEGASERRAKWEAQGRV